MSTERFSFTIGYTGGEAVVDKSARKQYGKLQVKELVDLGFYKPAFCKALEEDDQDGMQYILKIYNEKSGSDYTNPDQLVKLLGVYLSREGISKFHEI